MKAIVQDRYGSADVLRMEDVERPAIGDDEVLVRVRAAGVEPAVWHLVTGTPYLARLAFGLRRPKNRVPGMSLAGVVEEVGAAVTRFHPGDDVFGVGTGALAEHARARADKLAPLPRGSTFEQAAGIPISATTALGAVREGRVERGQSVLVIGAGGGVGSFAVQLAVGLGAEVTGVCSTSKVEFVRTLGAVDVIDYTREEVTERGRRYDVVIDTAGVRPLRALRRVLAPRGTLVVVGGEDDGKIIGPTLRAVRAALLSPFVRQRLRMLVSVERQEDLEHLARLVEAGSVTPVLERTYPLVEMPDALRHVAQGHTRGKVVVTVQP